MLKVATNGTSTLYVHASYSKFDVLELISDKQDATLSILHPYTIKALPSKVSERGVKKWKVKRRKLESKDKEKKNEIAKRL